MPIGDNEHSNELLDAAHRLSPYDTMSYAMLGLKAMNLAMLGQYDDAAELSIRGSRLLTFYCQMFPVFAALCNVMAARDDIANQYFSALLETRPSYSSRDYFGAYPHQRERDVAKINSAFESLNRIH